MAGSTAQAASQDNDPQQLLNAASALVPQVMLWPSPMCGVRIPMR